MVAHSVDYWWIWPLLTIVAFLIVIWHEEIIKAIRKHREDVLATITIAVGIFIALIVCLVLMP